MSRSAAGPAAVWVAIGGQPDDGPPVAGWLLADVAPDDPVVLRIWALLRAGAPLETVLDALLQHGLARVPGFVLVCRAAGEQVAVIRGPALLSYVVDGEPHSFDAAGTASWREVALPSAARALCLRTGPADPTDASVAGLESGVLLAAEVRLAEQGADDPVVDDQPPTVPPPSGGAARGRSAPGGASGSVPAVRCSQGHPNPPTAATCRACGLNLFGQPAVLIAQPALGVLRLSTGDVVTLDRGVIIGRNPTPADTPGAGQPHVVRVAGPGQDVSRTHVELRVSGWQLLVRDLNSVNGTVVTPPWQEPRRLRPNEAVPIEPGTVVSLADEVSFRYEVT